MATGIFAATHSNGSNTFAVCPNWTNGACACPKDPAGNLMPTPPLATAHPAYTFGATPLGTWNQAAAPAEWLALGKTQAQWSALSAAQQWGFCCAVEAIRLVKHDLAQATSTPMTALVGVTA